MVSANCQQQVTALSTTRPGKYYREHTKSLQKDGTQIPFYVLSEGKKEKKPKQIKTKPKPQHKTTNYCNLCCRRERPSVIKSHFLLFKNLFKELKNYTRSPVFSGSFLQVPLLLAGTSMLQYSCLCG